MRTSPAMRPMQGYMATLLAPNDGAVKEALKKLGEHELN